MELSFEQLPKAVGQILDSLERIEKLLLQKEVIVSEADNDSPFLTVHEAAKFLKVPSSSIYKRTCIGEIPCLKKGGRLYFVKSELMDWVKTGRVKTSYEIKQEAINCLIKSARRKMR